MTQILNSIRRSWRSIRNFKFWIRTFKITPAKQNFHSSIKLTIYYNYPFITFLSSSLSYSVITYEIKRVDEYLNYNIRSHTKKTSIHYLNTRFKELNCICYYPLSEILSAVFPFYRYERNTIMSTLRQRNALRKLVNPGQSDEESNQSGQSGQSSQSNKNKRKKISARKNEVLVYLHRKFFHPKPVYVKVDKKKAAERKEALLKILEEFQEPEDNKSERKSKENKVYLRSFDTFPYPVPHKGKGKDNKLKLRSSGTIPYPVSSEGKDNDYKIDLWSSSSTSSTFPRPVSFKGKGEDIN
ncbi:uncharacterized protein OCT59_026805 [Rhizophagus irregularis]|nr:hypothetical protein OCT59_026805 [Rhizophagus irregularis]